MLVKKDNLKQQIKIFFTSGLDDNTDIEIKRKAILLNVISIIGILNLVPHGISAIIRDKIALWAFDLIVAGVLIVLLLLLRKIGYQPFLGYGVTGYSFVDAQFPRVLVETGILGFMAFCYLLISIFRISLNNLKELKTPYFQGLAIGFLAGFVGLVVHAMGANTFIIVRIMEPFWFFAGIMVVMPEMERQQAEQSEGVVAPGKALVSAS